MRERGRGGCGGERERGGEEEGIEGIEGREVLDGGLHEQQGTYVSFCSMSESARDPGWCEKIK